MSAESSRLARPSSERRVPRARASIQFNINFSSELYERVWAVAEERCVSASQVIREAVAAALAEDESPARHGVARAAVREPDAE